MNRRAKKSSDPPSIVTITPLQPTGRGLIAGSLRKSLYEYAFLLQSKSVGIVISKVKCCFTHQKYICIVSYFSYFSM